MDCTSTENLPTLDKDDLVVVGARRSRFPRRSASTECAGFLYPFGRQRLSGVPQYHRTRGWHPYCYLKLEGGAHFDGSEIYTKRWTEAQTDSFRTPALSKPATPQVNRYRGIERNHRRSNVRTEFTAESGYITANIAAAGGPTAGGGTQQRDAGLPHHALDAYADIIYVRDTNIVRTADSVYEGESSDNLLSEELSFVHERTLAQAHANLLGQFHRHAGSSYGFFSAVDLNCGTLVRLIDDAFSGLNVSVLVTARTFTDENAVYRYEAVGISAFDLSAPAYLECSTGQERHSRSPGPPGWTARRTPYPSSHPTDRSSDPSRSIRSSPATSSKTPPRSPKSWMPRVSMEAPQCRPVDDGRWNTSSKAIAHKSVEIKNADCVGRTVFFCEIDLTGYEA